MEVDENNWEEPSSNRKKTRSKKRKDNQEMECDLSAYVLFHEGNTGAPCLSFDIVRDNLGENRNCETPATCYFVCGSQASKPHLNNITLLKMSNLRKVSEEDNESEGDESDEEEEDTKPLINYATTSHNGCVNRIRTHKLKENILAASWSELGQVYIWNLSDMVQAVDDIDTMRVYQDSPQPKPIFTFHGHSSEGFALDWSPTVPGNLITGDCSSNIFLWKQQDGSWVVDENPFRAHTDSVEDIQWSSNEENVFASCSVDKSIRIWDTRAAPHEACMLTCEGAHDSDVNVIHWSKKEPFIASGGDDSKVLIWDLRKFQTNSPIADLKYHSGPVCTIEWHPSDGSVLASGSEDNKILQWDLAVEKDPQDKDQDTKDVPQQLLFIHEGQKEVKELHWHPQVPGLIISTAHSGFNIFKTISC